ncbi:MAG: HEPN domain-containing protein [bacterium]
MSKEELRIYIERAEESYKAAGILYKDKLYRESVSRGYYAIYYAAKAIEIAKEIIVNKHQGVISRFYTDLVDKGVIPKEYHRILDRAFKYREMADYNIYKEIAEDMAKEQLDNARRFIDEIKGCLIKEGYLGE